MLNSSWPTAVRYERKLYNRNGYITPPPPPPPHPQVRLRDMYENPARRFHLSSCQFSLHYSFEKYERAHMMLRNACENLRPGGFFIGTTIDSNEVMYVYQESYVARS